MDLYKFVSLELSYEYTKVKRGEGAAAEVVGTVYMKGPRNWAGYPFAVELFQRHFKHYSTLECVDGYLTRTFSHRHLEVLQETSDSRKEP